MPTHAPVTAEIVQETIREAYGMEGELHRLPGENLNFLVETPAGEKLVAKLAGDEVPHDCVEMEYLALTRAEKAGLGIEFPTLQENKYGNYETFIKTEGIDSKRLRLLHYIKGSDLSGLTDISDNLRFEVGKSLACFDQAMAGFDHPAAHRKHRWDLAHADQHQDKVQLVDDPKKRKLLDWAYRQFTNNISPVLGKLKWQFIHGDGNPENLRVQGDHVIGLLDFGDSCFNPRVCELAICLAYQMMDQDDPCAAAKHVVDGYQSVLPLSAAEQSVLLPLVCTRLAVTLSVAAERRQIDAENTNWFVSEAPAWALLTQLSSLPVDHFKRVSFSENRL